MANIKYTKEQCEEVRKLILTGMAYKDIADKTGLPKGYIKQLTYLMDEADKEKLIALRKRIGATNNRKYTEDQREEVKRLILTGMPYREIAEKTGISRGYIGTLACSMKGADKKKLNTLRKRIGTNNYKYTEEQREEAKKLILTGMPYKDIADKMGMLYGYIWKLASSMNMDEADKEKLIALRNENKNHKQYIKYTIYAVLMNGEPVYVGKTAQTLNERFSRHCSNKESAVYPLIKKYGKENFSIETLAIAYDEEQAAMLEDKWTIYLLDDNYKLSNKQIGNHGHYVGISKQSRENIDEWLNDKIDNGRYEELKKRYDELKKEYNTLDIRYKALDKFNSETCKEYDELKNEFLKVKEIGKRLYEFYKSSNEIIGNLKQELENERGEKNNILRRIISNVSDDYLKKELERREDEDAWAKFN